MFGPSPAILHTRSGMNSRPMSIFQSWVLVVVCALLLGTLAQFVGPQRIPWVEDHSRRVELKAVAAGIEMVDVARAKDIVEKGEFLVCDARKSEDFDAGHLPGAVSFPFGTHAETFLELAALFSSGATRDGLLLWTRLRRCLVARKIPESSGKHEGGSFCGRNVGLEGGGASDRVI